jgi:hypothetical protein
MNAKQSLKLAAKNIEILENYQFKATKDITAYNKCILSMIAGGSPCVWCNDLLECDKPEKTASRGCEDWMLAFIDIQDDDQDEIPVKIEGSGGDADESKGILSASSES